MWFIGQTGASLKQVQVLLIALIQCCIMSKLALTRALTIQKVKSDYAWRVELRSIQCISCLFHFDCRLNFQYERYICNGCYHCMQYKRANCRILFRVVKADKGTFRTMSSYFLIDIEKLLMENDLKDRFVWLCKHENAGAREIKLDLHTESNCNLSY